MVEHTVEARGVDGSNPSVPIALRGNKVAGGLDQKTAGPKRRVCRLPIFLGIWKATGPDATAPFPNFGLKLDSIGW